MREILFKAKRIDNGEWVYGNYAFCDCYTKQKHYIFQNKPLEYAIDETTLCQYTGVNDKNGNKIWENDIVKIPYELLKDTYCKVVFKYGQFIGELADETEDGIFNSKSEVIGNIFDNPELLQ